MIIRIEVPNKLLIKHFKDTLNKIGQVCVRDYYGNPKSIYVSSDTCLQLHTGFSYYSPFGAYKVIEDNSKESEQRSIVTVTISDRSYRDNLYNYWVRGKTTVKLDDFLNKTSSNSQDSTDARVEEDYPKYFVELTFKIPYGGKNLYSKFWSIPSNSNISFPDRTEIALVHGIGEGLSNSDYPELIQLGDDEDFNEILDIQLYYDEDCKKFSNVIAHRPVDSIGEYLVGSKLHKSLLVMLKGYDGSWFPSNGKTKLYSEDLEYILRNYPKIDSSFKQTFDIMANEDSGGPNRVDKFIKNQKEIMLADSQYYVEEMTSSTEDDGKIYAEPSLISDLMFY
ncbi:hypothetical protein HOU40_gp087 [Lactobacillus phage Bromius]|uniref:Uncharacterized protein n=1 Tax=Lactobacillus phage Bromius TaxID=2315485 RepID=A0A3Q8HXN4_9CAUD|nr:hypothetical protein HOU40_gp087 [Lactobacillus phage Bromius]AYH92323.1 hypothetical protein [Lactobacillus phage Bromius]